MKYELSIRNPSKYSKDELLEFGFKWDEDYDCKFEQYEPEYVPVFVELNTLEDLQEFIKKHGKVILYENSIEIDNGYSE